MRTGLGSKADSMVVMTEHELFNGVPNSRSLGGLPLKRGGTLKEGVFYRSSALASLTDLGRQQMEDTPIGVVADLRTLPERLTSSDKPPAHPHRIRVHELGIEAGNLSPTMFMKDTLGKNKSQLSAVLEKDIPTLAELYPQMLKEAPKQFGEVARLVAKVEEGKNNAVLVHCTAGKDRTGIAVALVLDSVGVERDAIIHNYAVSAQYLAGPWAEGMLAKIKSVGIPLVPRLVDMVTTTPPEAIEAAFSWIEDNFGSSENYLFSGGVSAAEIEDMRLALEQ